MGQKRMRGWRVTGFTRTDQSPRGKPLHETEWKTPEQVLTLATDLPIPECKPDQVLIRVNYAGVMYPDWLQLTGGYQVRPEGAYIPGMDCNGRIVEVGEEVTGFKVGDFVIARQELGALAELVAVPAIHVWPVPKGIELNKLANLGRNMFPAIHALMNLGKIEEGMSVFITGASGGVGTAAIALAKVIGATVSAGVSTEAKAEIAKAAGADRVFVYGDAGNEETDFDPVKAEIKAAAKKDGHPKGIDVVVDMVHGYLFGKVLKSIVRPGGKICMVGFAAGQQPLGMPGLLVIKPFSIIGCLALQWSTEDPKSYRELVQMVIDLIGEGKIELTVGHEFSFDDAPKAFALYENHEGKGGTVIKVS